MGKVLISNWPWSNCVPLTSLEQKYLFKKFEVDLQTPLLPQTSYMANANGQKWKILILFRFWISNALPFPQATQEVWGNGEVWRHTSKISQRAYLFKRGQVEPFRPWPFWNYNLPYLCPALTHINVRTPNFYLRFCHISSYRYQIGIKFSIHYKLDGPSLIDR